MLRAATAAILFGVPGKLVDSPLAKLGMERKYSSPSMFTESFRACPGFGAD